MEDIETIVKYEFTEHIYAADDGVLMVENVSTLDLTERFGTPLYVLSEAQIRHNVRAMARAFCSRYADTVVLFSNKANNNPTVRHVFNQEGAGGDCFGYGELYLSLLAGTDPDRLMLNGSNKQEPELEMAIGAGVTINLDSVEELALVECIAQRVGKPARVAPRTRLMLEPLDELTSDWPAGYQVGLGARMHKFGMHYADVEECCRRALASDWLELRGLHHHIGRWTNDTTMYRVLVAELVEWAARLRDALGWTPGHLDIGGGLAWGRPEGHGPGNNDRPAPDYDAYASAITETLIGELDRFELGRPGTTTRSPPPTRSPRSILRYRWTWWGRCARSTSWPAASTCRHFSAATSWRFSTLAPTAKPKPPRSMRSRDPRPCW